MEDDLEEERGIIENDPRIRYIAVYTIRSFVVKAEKWNKLMATPDYKQCILDFLEKPEVNLLLILISPAGILATANTYPPNIHRKYSFFSKYEPMKVTMENFRTNLFWGDMVANAMEGAAYYFEHIIGPMLAYSKAVEEYPETTRRHLKQRALEIREIGIRMRGEQMGIKLLPLPMDTKPIHDYYKQLKADPRKAVLDYTYMNTLERSVVTWHEIIDDLVKEDGSQLLTEDPYARPDAEIKFWQVRLKHLENLFEQLKDEQMQKVAFILQTTKSVAFPMFARALKKCVIALAEARDIEKYLRPLLKIISEVESTDFEENARLFKPLLHTVSLIWVHSEYYAYPTKIVRLLKMLANTMIAEAYKSLDTPTIYQAELDEILKKIGQVIANMQGYRNTFELYQESELEKVYPPGKLYKPWTFHHTMVFEQYDKHHERLKKIQKILLSVNRFQKVDKLEVGGYAGNNSLSYELKKNCYKFNKVVAKLRAIPYDPGDIQEEERFNKDYDWLQARADDFEDRLVYIAKYYFEECHNYDSVLKLFGLWGDFTTRPKFKEVLEPMYDKIVEIFRKEVYDLEEFYIRNLHPWDPDVKVNVPLYWPPLAGTILWTRTIRQRINKHLEIIDSFTDPVLRKKVDSGEFNWERLIVERILHRLDELEHDRYKQWVANIDSEIQHELRKPFFKLSSRYVLSANIRKKLEITMVEARYLKFLGIKNIPRNVMKLAKRRELYRGWIRVIEETAKWYNAFRKDTRNEEFEIIYEEVKGIDKYIDNTIHKYNWGTKCNGERITRICNRCVFLGVRLALAQKNLREILKISNIWNYAPIYHRPVGEFVDPGELLDYKDHNKVYQRYADIEEAGEEINDLIEQNFEFLHNMPRMVGPSHIGSTISTPSRASGHDIVIFEPIFVDRVNEEEGEVDEEEQKAYEERIKRVDEETLAKLKEGRIPEWMPDADVDNDLEQKLKKVSKRKETLRGSRATVAARPTVRDSTVRVSEVRDSTVGGSRMTVTAGRESTAIRRETVSEAAKAAAEGEAYGQEDENDLEGPDDDEEVGGVEEEAAKEKAGAVEDVDSDDKVEDEEEEFKNTFGAKKAESYEGIYEGTEFDVRSITIDVQRSIHKPLRPIMPIYRQKPKNMDEIQWETYLKKREFEQFVRDTAVEGQPIPYKEYEEKIILADLSGPLPHFERSNPLLAAPRKPIMPTEEPEGGNKDKAEEKASEEDDEYDLRKIYDQPYQFAAALSREWKRTRPTPRPRLDPLLFVPGLPPREQDIDYDALFTEVNEDEIPLEASSSDLDCGEVDFSGLYPDEELIAGKIPRNFFRKAEEFLQEFDASENVNLKPDLTEEISTLDLFAEVAKITERRDDLERTTVAQMGEGGEGQEGEDKEEREEVSGLADITDKWNRFIEKRCDTLREKFADKIMFADDYIMPYDSLTSLISINSEVFSVSTEPDSQTTVTPSIPSTLGSYSTTPRHSEDSICSMLSRIEPKTESEESSEPTDPDAPPTAESAAAGEGKSETKLKRKGDLSVASGSQQQETAKQSFKLSLEPTPSVYEDDGYDSEEQSDLLDDPRCQKLLEHLGKRPPCKRGEEDEDITSSSGRTYSDIQLYAASVPPYGFDRRTPSCSSSYASSFIFTSTPSETSETESDQLPSAISPIVHRESEAYTSTPSTLSDTVDESVKPTVYEQQGKAEERDDEDDKEKKAAAVRRDENPLRKAMIEKIQKNLMDSIEKSTEKKNENDDTATGLKVAKIPPEKVRKEEENAKRKSRKTSDKKQKTNADYISRKRYESKVKEKRNKAKMIDESSSEEEEEEKYGLETEEKLGKSFKRVKKVKEAFIKREKYGKKIKKLITDEMEKLPEVNKRENAEVGKVIERKVEAETVESSNEEEDDGKTIGMCKKEPKKRKRLTRRIMYSGRLKGMLAKEMQSIADIRKVALKSIEPENYDEEKFRYKPEMKKFILGKKFKLSSSGKTRRKRSKMQKKNKGFRKKTKKMMNGKKKMEKRFSEDGNDKKEIEDKAEEVGGKHRPIGWKCLKRSYANKGIAGRINFGIGTKRFASQMKDETEKREPKEKLMFFDEILNDESWKYDDEETIKIYYPPEFGKFGYDNPDDIRYDPDYKNRKSSTLRRQEQDDKEEKWYKGDPELVYKHLAERFSMNGKELFADIINEESAGDDEEADEDAAAGSEEEEESESKASSDVGEEESSEENYERDGVPYIELDRGGASSSTGVSSTPESTMKTVSLCSILRKYAKKPSRRAIWDRYLELIDAYVKEGLFHAVGAAVFYIDSEMNNERNNGPLFEVQMKVIDDKLTHEPSLIDDENEEGSFIFDIASILKNINAMALMIPRISYYQRHRTYMDEVLEHKDIMDGESRIIMKARLAVLTARNYSANFERFSYLWTENKEVHLRQFLKFGRKLTEEEAEIEDAYDEYGNRLLRLDVPNLEKFRKKIDEYEEIYQDLLRLKEEEVIDEWFRLSYRIFKKQVLNFSASWAMLYKQHLIDQVWNSVTTFDKFVNETSKGLSKPLAEGDYDGLVKVMGYLREVDEYRVKAENFFQPIEHTMNVLRNYGHVFPLEIHGILQTLPDRWEKLKKRADRVQGFAGPLIIAESDTITKRLSLFGIRLDLYLVDFLKKPFWNLQADAYYEIDRANDELKKLEFLKRNLDNQANLFNVEAEDMPLVTNLRKDLTLLKTVWDYVFIITSMINDWEGTKWRLIDSESMDMDLKRLAKELKGIDRSVRNWDIFIYVENMIKNLITALRAITDLQNPAVKSRHWAELLDEVKMNITITDDTILKDLLSLNLHKYEEEVKTVVDKSVKEQQIEKLLGELAVTWAAVEFEYDSHARTGLKTLRISEESVELLEDNQVQIQNMISSKFVGFYQKQVSEWQKKLSDAEQMITVWMEVQRIWRYLESIFIESEDIRKTLPEDTKLFDQSDALFKSMLKQVEHVPNVVQAAALPNILSNLNILIVNLQKCEKALTHYLDTKKLVFPRFYFLSNNDLMDILANSMQPHLVCKHLSKLYDSLSNLKFKKDQGKMTKIATGMWAKDGEYCDMFGECELTGAVENYLNSLTAAMVGTVRENFRLALIGYEKKPRHEWIFDFPAQAVMVIVQIMWSAEVGHAFKLLSEGHDNAMKDYNKKQIWMLSQLINVMLGELTDDSRMMITAICTIEVHSRDIVAKMIASKVGSAKEFQWQSQLRHRWDMSRNDCFINICDAQFLYQYEYFGNQPRLVITPLTDRCYITLTQSLHLVMGGAPAGPAGTGKTETTKDLSKGLGIMIYVFNCSEQMDFRSVGNIYKGLSQTGAWGCFDEFNRISVEVLSVVAVQVKSVLDAIKAKKTMFNFQGEVIRLVSTVGMFITMNPGYAGRAELPENLKALFRPCAMVVPDFDLICENMLIGEAFQEARILGKKFITLYELCKELLSKQDHYDWGLRAIKSVLRVAGSLRRGDIERPEDQVLMRALRDFNIPKIVTDDKSIFMGLIGDLFPALDVPRKRDLNFEKLVHQAALDMKLQPEDGFILKIVQLVELFAVRHSVFILGIAGAGKSCVWKTLHRTYANMKLKPHYNDLEPKAVTNDELFGIINPSTREWKDGLFSVLLRDQANMAGTGPKWMVMDGDIDPMWIESLNTVMDDNKVLTLASNERIALTPSMRLLFEISNLRTATPATVSRAGILFINPTDLGWRPYVRSWLDRRNDESNREMLEAFFEKYVPNTLIASKKVWKIITPIPEIAHIHMLCSLLELLYTPANVPRDCPREHYEIYFVFSCCWAFGSACHLDQMGDNRVKFSTWWVGEFKTIKFPEAVIKGNTTVFHYFIEDESKRWVLWSERMPSFTLDYDIPLQQTLVSTAETTRIRFFLDLLIANKKPTMLIAPAGCGKSVLIGSKLSLFTQSEDYAVTNIAFNFYTTSEMLQKVLEKPLEKKAGRNYGPPGNKTMIYFIDDMNMPEVDKYGTVQPHTLIRQHMDYQHWYDRTKLTLKDIHNIMFVSSMNPTAGSFTIDSRLQRHFTVFALSFPTADAVKHIYTSLLGQHLQNPHYKFKVPVMQFTEKLVNVALAMHFRMQTEFLPTAIKFHYIFNLRDLGNIFQAILMTTAECITSQGTLVRVWMHEATRVYSDKLVTLEEQKTFDLILRQTILKLIPEVPEDEYLKLPRMYCHFAEGIGDPKYMEVHSWSSLFALLTEAMDNYSELIATMNLVLFEDAMSHICRINRVMEMPRGNALLVGVGGSGKQSLSRLSAFISSLEAFQVQLTKGYGTADLKADLASIYLKAGLRNVGIMFLMTDSQIPDERFLVLINDMLSSGEIPELFADDEVDQIVTAVAPEAKSAGIPETKQACWKFFIDRVRKNLKTILSFSPVGSTLRVRARKFPALVNCTTIDWFMEWPQSALESVSLRFLEDVEELPEIIRKPMSLLMAYIHTIVNQMSDVYRNNEKRYNYTTPKSFLELIGLYRKLLKSKSDEVLLKINRLENGLDKLVSCSEQVAGLKEQLAVQGVIVAEKNKKASELITVVAQETEIVSKEKKFAKEEERKCQIIEEDVRVKQKMCEDDLAKAMPALEAAQAALNTLNKTNLTEMKSFGTPPPAVAKVAAAVLVLMAKKGKIPKDRSWKAAKAMMGSADGFLSSLVNYNKENIHPEIVKAIVPYIKDPEFTPENVITKSSAAAGLCAWVINIMKFHEVWMVVLPKKKAEAAAKAELAAARAKLAALDERIRGLESKLAILTDKFNLAMAEKNACQAEEDKTKQAIDLANRLVNGLASENVRWRQTVAYLKDTTITLPGDVILVTAFISYVGCFTRRYREDMLHKSWKPRLNYYEPSIPHTDGLDPLSMLTDDAQIAAWNNEGLPNDRMSAENATILMNSDRWPLMIDPQLQGIKWIKTKYGSNLLVIRLGQKGYLDKIEMAVADGRIMLIENIGEYIDPVLDNLLSRNLIRKGRVLKIGDREIDYNQKFRLIFQTKLANPHYQPEIQAQTTLINFTVTRDGLEDQLLAEVVKAERPDLEKQKSTLTKQQNNFKIQLKLLEDELLHRLSAAGPDILSDRELVEKLESTKKTAESIALKVEEAKITTVNIDIARESYRSIATRASILYFILNELNRINLLYQFSLKAFSTVFHQAIATSAKASNLKERVDNLTDNITFCVFMYTSRGLFECDKLIFLCQMAIQILVHAGEIKGQELDFLLKYPYKPNVKSKVPFLTDVSWGGIAALVEMEEFINLDNDIVSGAERWKKYVDGETPERDKFPQEWGNKSSFQQLLIIRSLRPDRMTYALRIYIHIVLGEKYITARSVEFEKSYQETTPQTAVFFILSPGVDPTRDVERLGNKLGFTTDKQNFHNISLGQGQEPVAEEAITISSENGHWVILQNIHLVARWLPTLDKRMEKAAENPHPNYRLYLSSEPGPDPSTCIIPQGVLESSIKITNEPPTGMMANLHKALDNFNQATLDMCSKESEFKAILFGLCYFHAVVAERRKFGPQGWNRNYPFNVGDLTISIMVLHNYLENNVTVPWVDLRYLFGEIMYGGHITDDRDRRLCRTYLEVYLDPAMIEGEHELAPGFQSPPNSDYQGYHRYIDAMLPAESPVLYGLHLNAEIGFLTTQATKLFKTLMDLQPKDTGETKGTGPSREEQVNTVIDTIMQVVKNEFLLADMLSRMEEATPYNIVALQECERMNMLTGLMQRTLKELSLGLKGELTITSDMEDLEQCIVNDIVPPQWSAKAYPSELGLMAWFADLELRIKELDAWTNSFRLPNAVWLGGLFNPNSFLTAIMQMTARKNEWPLDKMCLQCEVLKKKKREEVNFPREGSNIYNLYMEGARWDINANSIAEAVLKEMYPLMPVIYVKAITQDKQDLRGTYECPVYKTVQRGPTYVQSFHLKTKEKASKWILGGVGLLLSI